MLGNSLLNKLWNIVSLSSLLREELELLVESMIRDHKVN